MHSTPIEISENEPESEFYLFLVFFEVYNMSFGQKFQILAFLLYNIYR